MCFAFWVDWTPPVVGFAFAKSLFAHISKIYIYIYSDVPFALTEEEAANEIK